MVNKFSNIKERILQLTDFKGITKEEFFKSIGMSYGSFKGSAKDRPLNSDAIENILTIYADVNPEWLLLGKGSWNKNETLTANEPPLIYGSYDNDEVLYLDDNNEPEIFYNDKTHNKYFIYPDGTIRIEVLKVPFSAHASYIECYDDEVKLNSEFSTLTFKVDHIGRGKYLGFESKGDSMWNDGGYDTPSGADILGRQVGRHLWASGFHKSKYGFILITNSGIFHKDIDKIDENGNLVLTSRNPDHKSFKYPINEVREVYHVIKRSF